MVLRALKKATEEKGKASLEPIWELVRDDLWPSVKKGMEIVAARLGQHRGHPEIARSCLELIDTFDISSTPDYEDDDAFLAWADNFDEDESLVPDACIRMLGRFLPGADDVKSYRLRRTRRMDAQRVPSTFRAQYSMGILEAFQAFQRLQGSNTIPSKCCTAHQHVMHH